MREPTVLASDALPPTSEIKKHLAYAEASMMLLEGLLQLFIARRIFTAEEIVGTVESIIATKQQMVDEGEHPEISSLAVGALSTLANSVAAIDAAAGGTRKFRS